MRSITISPTAPARTRGIGGKSEMTTHRICEWFCPVSSSPIKNGALAPFLRSSSHTLGCIVYLHLLAINDVRLT